MKFGSVCSGIEAASVAWNSLGWEAAWLSEIEPFPSAVLKHHYPDVPNLGDMTALPDRILSGEIEAPDLFCGGTPCQAFSVAGLRNSLDDARGNLSLTFVGIANAIDHVRSVRGDSPAIIFWENVPGVLSTKDNAFGCFLGALAGEDDPIVPPGEKWTNAGCVYGPQRTVAWRVLDAQYFGVAQRRRRVFVVASARDDFNPTEVLFEFNGVRRDTAPSREKGKEITECAGTLTANGGGLNRPAGNANELDFCVTVETAKCLTAGGNMRYDFETEDFVLQPTYAIQGSMIGRNDNAGPQGDGINEEVCFTQNTIDRHAVAQSIAFGVSEQPHLGHCLRAGASKADKHESTTYVAQPLSFDLTQITSAANRTRAEPGLPASTLAKGSDMHVAIAFTQNQRDEAVAQPSWWDGGQVAATITTKSDDQRMPDKANAQLVMQPITYDSKQHHNPQPSDTAQLTTLNCAFVRGDTPLIQPILAPTLTASNDPSRSPQSTEVTNQVAAVHSVSMAVRRLTPIECERLQGFPDNYTEIPWRKKPADQCPDGPRYKALGNSWAVPVVHWIGKRIQAQLEK